MAHTLVIRGVPITVMQSHNPLVAGLPIGHFASPGGPLCPWVHHPSPLEPTDYAVFRRWIRGLLVHGSPLTTRHSVISFWLKPWGILNYYLVHYGILRRIFPGRNHPISESTFHNDSNLVPIIVYVPHMYRMISAQNRKYRGSFIYPKMKSLLGAGTASYD
jgi:hypothetical protein